MTQQAVIETAPAQATPAADQPAGQHCVSDRASDEALVADELLVEEVSIDGMCGVY
jgi:mycofactocin precursor